MTRKTYVFLPGDRSLELCGTEQQDNVKFDPVEFSFPRVLWSRFQREVRKINFNCAELCIFVYTFN